MRKVFKTGFEQAPGCGQTCDTAPDDHHRDTLPCIRRDFNVLAIAQAMTKHVGCSDDFTNG